MASPTTKSRIEVDTMAQGNGELMHRTVRLSLGAVFQDVPATASRRDQQLTAK